MGFGWEQGIYWSAACGSFIISQSVTDVLLHVCSDFDVNIKYCLLTIQLSGKVQTNFCKSYLPSECLFLIESPAGRIFVLPSVQLFSSVHTTMLIVEWKVYTFKIHMFPSMNTNFAGPLSLVWNCNRLVWLIGHSYIYNVCQYVFTENSSLLGYDTVLLSEQFVTCQRIEVPSSVQIKTFRRSSSFLTPEDATFFLNAHEHIVTSQKTWILHNTAVKTSNFAYPHCCLIRFPVTVC
jgi:hypothetical protein